MTCSKAGPLHKKGKNPNERKKRLRRHLFSLGDEIIRLFLGEKKEETKKNQEGTRRKMFSTKSHLWLTWMRPRVEMVIVRKIV